MQYDSVKKRYVWQDDKLGEAGGTLWWIKYDNERLVIFYILHIIIVHDFYSSNEYFTIYSHENFKILMNENITY
jgi:hypothetical protein